MKKLLILLFVGCVPLPAQELDAGVTVFHDAGLPAVDAYGECMNRCCTYVGCYSTCTKQCSPGISTKQAAMKVINTCTVCCHTPRNP